MSDSTLVDELETARRHLRGIDFNELDPDELRSLLGAIDTLGEITASQYRARIDE